MPKEMAAQFDEEAWEHDQLFVGALRLKPFYDAVEAALRNCDSKETNTGSGLRQRTGN